MAIWSDKSRYDAEFLFRSVEAIACAALTTGVIYVVGFGVFEDVFVKGGALILASVISIAGTMATVAKRGSAMSQRLRVFAELLLLCVSLYVLAQWVHISWIQEESFVSLTDWDNAFAYVGLCVILVLTYRHFGLALTLAAAIALLYIIFADSMPGIFKGPAFDWQRGADRLWFNFDGVFGRPLGVVTRVVLVFIIFGAVLERCGAGETLLRFASAATGRIVGGPAHAAIVSSAVFGTMNGAAVANVVATGVFTIPVIKKSGFRARFAGAVEAAASSGGQIMPPVMGIVAFYMADVTGIPYVNIIIAAAIPALFYYFSLFLMVRFEAGRLGTPPTPEDQRIRLTRQDWIRSLVFVGPIVALGWQLFEGRSPAYSGFVALIAAFVLGIALFPQFRSLRTIASALVYAGRSCAMIVIVAATIGIIIAVVSMSGFGVRFAAFLVAVSESSLFLSLIAVMIGCLVLGMGLPTGAAYLLIVLAIGPALQKLGLPMMAAHLFVIYYAVLSAVTPPVALAAFAAAPICGANPMAVGMEALKLATAGFIIPFVFAYHQDILFLEGYSVFGALLTIGLFVVSSWLIATALIGYEWGKISFPERLPRFALGLAVLVPHWLVAGPALGLSLALVVFRFVQWNATAPVHAARPVPSPE